jgi:hypothetical protein
LKSSKFLNSNADVIRLKLRTNVIFMTIYMPKKIAFCVDVAMQGKQGIGHN